MEDIEKAISTLEGLIRCTDLDELQKMIREFEELAGKERIGLLKRKRKSGKQSLNSEGMPPIYQLNEETKALVKKVEKLSARGIFPEGIALDACKDKIGFLPTSKLAGETTAQRNKESILGMIKGDVRKIGVYGMGGIGKTTVMKHINNDLLQEENKQFDCVIWVTVSKESSVFKLQDIISRKLGLDLSTDEDPITRAGAIFENLKRKGRYLLILDDLWEEYPLEEVGIPDPDSANGCKLVLTTRSLDVCQSMKCEAIKMDLLAEDEAWSLFLYHVGHDVLNIKDLESIVRGVASECARLPLAISTIGRSMRGKKEACEWRVALAKLRAFSKDPNDKGKRVIEQLKFSYERLENNKLKNCLLYCALYPEDYAIERSDLVELLALEGIIEEKECKRDEIDEGNAMLNHLINQCLLEGKITSQENSWVKMHDLTRDMALQIDYLHSQYLTISGAELKSSDVKWSRDLLRIHISYFYSLNVSSICSKLTTFILQGDFLSKISDSFFLNFKSLKVLNLYFCHSLEELPNSISDLVNLVGLLLRDCPQLRYVPPLARLKDLRSLEFCTTIGRFFERNETYLTKVPEGLEQLSNLRYLNLISFPIKVFPYGIIPRLSNLRYLICNPFTKVIVDELMSLKNLEMFKGGFQDIHDLRVYVNYREQHRLRLTSYIFLVGSTPGYPRFIIDAYRGKSFDKVVKLNCNLDKTPRENDLSLLPKDVQVLEIENVSDLTSLFALASLNYATDLRICTIERCSRVREVVTASSSAFALLSLEKLQLGYLENLKALIGRKKAPCIVFSCLQQLRIYGCARIKAVLNIGLLSNLNNLKELIVHDCKELVEIIGESVNDDNGLNEARTDIILPKLWYMFFMDLPNLKSICPASTRLICESLKEMFIVNCPKLEQCVYAALEDNGQQSPGPYLHPIELKFVNKYCADQDTLDLLNEVLRQLNGRVLLQRHLPKSVFNHLV